MCSDVRVFEVKSQSKDAGKRKEERSCEEQQGQKPEQQARIRRQVHRYSSRQNTGFLCEAWLPVSMCTCLLIYFITTSVHA